MTSPQTVGELENALFTAFPKGDAEPWDQPGLGVGSREETVGKVAVALDMSVANVIKAAAKGCNVLVTHHPPFIKEGPKEFGPYTQALTPGPGRMIFEASKLGINTIAMHTNLDRSIAARDRFAQLMGCSCLGNCETLFDPGLRSYEKGFGALLIPDWDMGSNLKIVAELCARNFQTSPRVWGDPESPVKKIAFLNGSWGDSELYEACISGGVDCVIVGETKYHLCVDAQPYLSIVELGHDRSELPLVDVLIDALEASGIDEDAIVDLREDRDTWWSA